MLTASARPQRPPERMSGPAGKAGAMLTGTPSARTSGRQPGGEDWDGLTLPVTIFRIRVGPGLSFLREIRQKCCFLSCRIMCTKVIVLYLMINKEYKSIFVMTLKG